MKLQYDNRRTAAEGAEGLTQEELDAGTGPRELFCEFFEKQNGAAPDAEQERLLEEIWDRIGGDKL